jgi:hypothetical protein
MKKLSNGLSVVMAIWLLVAGCGGGGGSGGSDNGGGSGGNSGTANLNMVSNEDWQSLSEEDKMALTNKAHGTLYKGVASKDFFDYSIQSGRQVIQDDSNQIAVLENKLSRSLGDIDAYLELIDEKYNFDSRRKPLQYPLAMLYELPISKEFYDAWMAYQLINTILFSPAIELESCDYIDIQYIFYRLFHMIGEDASIRDIVYEHMISQENWRRFRSPEDNTREMMEIFLGHFEDGDVPIASQACKNWSLTDESDGYRLFIDFDDNREPLKLLGTTVYDCYDFYDAVAEHGKLIPAVAARLVDIFFTGYGDNAKKQIARRIASSNPRTFRALFSKIIFSKEYLLKVSRPKRFEEAFFNIVHRINWFANRNFFKDINHAYSGSSYPSLYTMKQAAMTYKLGKPVEIPLDTLSFSYYHKAIRERILIDKKSDPFNDNDGGWQAGLIDVNQFGDDFVNYLFMAVLSRQATRQEIDELRQIMIDRGYDYDREERELHRAMIVLDYISRLSELYYTKSFK